MKIETTQITLDDALVENENDVKTESIKLKENENVNFYHEKQEPPTSQKEQNGFPSRTI